MEKLSKRTFFSGQEYREYLMKMSCEQLKQHDPNSVRVPDEKHRIYNRVLNSKCKGASLKAVSQLIRIADELDNAGLTKEASVVDKTLQELSKLIKCENC